MSTKAVMGGIMLSLLALAACPGRAVAAETGKPAPGFTLTDLSGNVHSLPDFAGKIVVLEWTNPNCPVVRRVYGEGVMTAVQKQFAGKDIVWLAVNSTSKNHGDFESAESMRKIYGEWGAGFTALLLDADGTVGKKYDARTTPHMFIINAEGILVYDGAIDNAPRGGKDGTVNYVKAALEELRSGKYCRHLHDETLRMQREVLDAQRTPGNAHTSRHSLLAASAEEYVRLVLAVGTHDADYVDAYYGPPAWKAETTAAPPTLETIEDRARKMLGSLEAYRDPAPEEIGKLRLRYLLCQARALIARVQMLRGRKMSFDEESRALYDAVAPTHTEEFFEGLLEDVGALLPGAGDIPERFETHKRDFLIPRDRLDRVFTAAIAEGRARSAAHITLPAGEEFSIEYVTGKSWSGYNWYKGGSTSLIQMNVDFPITIDRAVDLACHEGYPGHHVYNSLLEKELVRKRGWMEYSVYALFSPQSLIAEGTANFGIDMAFPGHERVVSSVRSFTSCGTGSGSGAVCIAFRRWSSGWRMQGMKPHADISMASCRAKKRRTGSSAMR